MGRPRCHEAANRILVANEGEDSFLVGPEFEQFLDEEVETVDVILREIGLIR